MLGQQRATLFFRAEATGEGGDVNRVTLSAESVANFLVHEQPFLISEDGVTPEIDVTVEDGDLDLPVGFRSEKEVFTVSTGPDDLLYKIVVYNFGPSDATDLQIVDALGTDGRGIACREIPDIDPTCPGCPDRFPNPRQGMIDGGSCSPSGFTWRIGTVEGNIAGLTAAVLYFRAEALEEGTAINRVELSGGGLPFPVVIEEPTAIFAD